ncbi:non-specific lipid transfer protein GPI-anchored 15-like isoform X1 [Coffea arabica]|uniref:Non-specific lipid transfer protein GPI-anchored 15-like isoform X1 n=1 Tax=Coffea arabica TaxID=13443 RepID=A0A6P6X0Z3_COFAR
MAPKGIVAISLVLATVTIFSAGGAVAQSNCNNVIITMSSCLNYVTGQSPTPPPSCCSALANVVQTNPRCLCAVIGGGSRFGFTINSTLALSLPDACKVQTPPVSRCNAANGPAMSPVGSPETSPGPAGSADGTPDSTTDPSVTGSKATPGSSSSGSVAQMHLQLVGFLLLLVSSYVSKFSCF